MEINTLEILDDIRGKYSHIKTIVPIVDFNQKTLYHKLYENDSDLHKNKYGISEPSNSPIFTHLETIDIILVPLLAFDKEGNRVGYGGGYYDKFLQGLPGKKIGLSLEEPIDLIKDINKHDVKLDYCITPSKIYNFQK